MFTSHKSDEFFFFLTILTLFLKILTLHLAIDFSLSEYRVNISFLFLGVQARSAETLLYLFVLFYLQSFYCKK